MSGYEIMKRRREAKLESSVRELESLADSIVGRNHFLSEESFKLGLKFAISEIEATERLHIKAFSELPFANPKDAEREHKNMINVLAVLKSILLKRYEGKP